jgi:hypothetical protein
MSPILQGLANGSARGYGAFVPLSAAGPFQSIASASGTGSSGTITFSSIPSTYQHLQLRYISRANTGAERVSLQFNSDTSSNYAWHFIRFDGALTAAGGANATMIDHINSTYSTTSIVTVGIVDIQDYSSTTRNKTIRNFSGWDANTTGAEIYLSSGLWRSTSALSSISIKLAANNFTTETQFALYGIKGA